MDRRTRKRLERSRRILDTAQSILLAEGLEAVTVHRIARELDLTVGALYRYFPSKQALFTALGEDIVRSFTEALNRIADLYKDQAHSDATPITEIMTIGFGFLEMAAQSPDRYRMVDLMLVDPRTMVPEDQRMNVLQTLFELLERVEKRLEQAADSKLITQGKSRERTIALWSAILGITSMHKMRTLYPEQVPAQNLEQELLHSIFIGWGCDVGVLKEASQEAAEFIKLHSSETFSQPVGEPVWR